MTSAESTDTPELPLDAPRQKPKKKFIFIAVIALLVLAGAGYYILHLGEETTDDATVEAHIAPIAAEVAGRIITLNIADNQVVKKGDLMLEVDPRDYIIARDRAKAALLSAQSKLAGANQTFTNTSVNANSMLTSAQAQVAAAEAEWERTKQELNRLRKLDPIARSQQALDAAVATERSAHASLNDAQASLRTAETAPNTISAAQADIQDLQAMIEIAKADLAQAEKNLAETKVVAPIDGTVTRRNAELGAYVQPAQQLLSLVGRDIWVVANFKETQLKNMKPGQKVDIEIDAHNGQHFTGKIDSLQTGTGARFSLFPPENATGNFVKIVQRVPVKIIFDRQPDARLHIGPGMSVDPTVYTQ